MLSFERKASPFFAKALFELRSRSLCRRWKFEPKLLIFDGESSQAHERIAKSITV
jgi:hypothetical protein